MPSAAPLLGASSRGGGRRSKAKKTPPARDPDAHNANDASVAKLASLVSRASARNEKKLLARVSSKLSKVMGKNKSGRGDKIGSETNKAPSRSSRPRRSSSMPAYRRLPAGTSREPQPEPEPRPKSKPPPPPPLMLSRTRTVTAGSSAEDVASLGRDVAGLGHPEVVKRPEEEPVAHRRRPEEFIVETNARLEPLPVDRREAERARHLNFRTEGARERFSLGLALSPTGGSVSDASDAGYRRFEEALGSAADALEARGPGPVLSPSSEEYERFREILGAAADALGSPRSRPARPPVVGEGASDAPEVVEAPSDPWNDDDDDDDSHGVDVDDFALLPPEDDPAGDGGGHISDQCSIPSLGPQQERLDDDSIPDMDNDLDGDAVPDIDRDVPLVVSTPPSAKSTKEMADSTLAWTALAAVLGSPAPSSATRKRAPQERADLWGDDAQGPDLLPELDDESLRGGESDSISMPSLGPQQEQLDDDAVPDIIPDIDSGNVPLAISTPPTAKSTKEMADSTLAWTALAAVLGSPAPSSAARKRTPQERADLWGSDPGPDLLPELDDKSLDSLDSLPEVDSDGSGIHLIGLDEADKSDGSDPIDGLVDEKTKKREAADATLAWGALGMLLGSPAPKSVSRKGARASGDAARNLWNEGDDEDLDAIPSMDEDGAGGRGVPEAVEASSDATGSSGDSPRSGACADEGGSSGQLAPPAPRGDALVATPKRAPIGDEEVADAARSLAALSLAERSPGPRVDRPRTKREVDAFWSEVFRNCDAGGLTSCLLGFEC